MQTNVRMSVTGTKELVAQFRLMSTKAQGRLIDQAVHAGAEVIKESIQTRIREQGLVDSGALLNSVLVSPADEMSIGGVKFVFVYEVGTYIENDYDWVHEYGAEIVPKSSPYLVFEIDGHLVFTKRVVIPARPYFRPGVEEGAPEAQNVIKATFIRVVLGKLA